MQRSRCSATRLVLVEHWLLWFQLLLPLLALQPMQIEAWRFGSLV